jgi:hypothetical protein
MKKGSECRSKVFGDEFKVKNQIDIKIGNKNEGKRKRQEVEVNRDAVVEREVEAIGLIGISQEKLIQASINTLSIIAIR